MSLVLAVVSQRRYIDIDAYADDHSEQTQLRAGIFNNIDYSARHVAPTIESWSMSFHEFQPLPWDIVEDNRIVTVSGYGTICSAFFA